ncbi:MAG: hypoxanthine phosphoribosyltransferase [Armatimonadota bacterium]
MRNDRGSDDGERLTKDLSQIVLSAEQIQAMVAELGAAVQRDYDGLHPVLLGVLKGSIVFLADLLRQIEIPVEVDFVAAASYGSSAESSGTIKVRLEPTLDITGRHVLVIEDIIDTGLTLSKLLETIREREPASLKVCTLLDKPARRKTELAPDYVGCEIPDEFVVGYGLDYAEKYRNLPCVGVLRREVYERNGA